MTASRGPGLDGGFAAPAPFANAETSGAIEPADTGTVAFVGRTLKGPVNEPVVITDFARFQRIFGGLWSDSLLPHSVEQFFEHGGTRAVIVRVASGARAPTIDLPAGRGRLTLVGIIPGCQEALRASVDHDGIARQDQDLFNLVVQRVRRRGSELVEEQEIFRRVSILPGSARELTRKLAASQLVRVAGPLPAVRPDITRGPDPRALIGYVECNGDGDDGELLSDYDLIGSGADRTGICALQGGPAFNFLYLPPPSRERDVGMSALVVGARLCRARQALLLVDPPRQWRSVQEALDGLADWPFHSADALMFFPRVSAPDRLTGTTAEFPPSAAAIGTLLRDAPADSWAEPAEPALLRPGTTPLVWVDHQQRARLAQRGGNALRTTRAARRDAVPPCTLAGELGNGADARLLSARRLALYLAASIERGTHWVSLEGNTPRSRERVCRQVEQFLAHHARQGAFGDAARERHWFVLCDERLNGPLEVASGVFRLVWGFHSPHAATRLSWLVEHRPAGSSTRAVSLNQFAALG
ncbi:MAG TPA: hypothetical protein VNQ32_08025 [Steroidobacteraceae bacterium]|nr:hypothetical protein [Steroidobacteraceae bacterium]